MQIQGSPELNVCPLFWAYAKLSTFQLRKQVETQDVVMPGDEASRVKRAHIVCISLTITLIITNLPVLISTSVYGKEINFGGFKICMPKNRNQLFLAFSLIYSFLPTMILIILSVVIVKQIKTLANRIRPESRVMSVMNRQRKTVLFMLISVVVSFLILTTPLNLYYMTTKPTGDNIFSIAACSVNVISLLNNAINFLLYCYTAKSFREQFYKVIAW